MAACMDAVVLPLFSGAGAARRLSPSAGSPSQASGPSDPVSSRSRAVRRVLLSSLQLAVPDWLRAEQQHQRRSMTPEETEKACRRPTMLLRRPGLQHCKVE
jgi:hypothetical protein